MVYTQLNPFIFLGVLAVSIIFAFFIYQDRDIPKKVRNPVYIWAIMNLVIFVFVYLLCFLKNIFE